MPYELWKSHFNSHAHVERDISADVKTVNNFISTHTLTWSVTVCHELKYHADYFNSHAHVERDDGLTGDLDGISISTHTLTWSVTYLLTRSPYLLIISTHTLTWSVTTDRMSNYGSYWISTHTLTWSVTPPRNLLSTAYTAFQLTRSRGA